MTNYQNMTRYGRQGNLRQAYPTSGANAGCSTPSCTATPMETQYEVPHSISGRNGTQRGECGCAAPVSQSEPGFCMAREEARRSNRRTSRSSCGRRKEEPLYGMPVAMAYVPWQNWEDVYDLCDGFSSGTIFKELTKPFLGRGGWKR